MMAVQFLAGFAVVLLFFAHLSGVQTRRGWDSATCCQTGVFRGGVWSNSHVEGILHVDTGHILIPGVNVFGQSQRMRVNARCKGGLRFTRYFFLMCNYILLHPQCGIQLATHQNSVTTSAMSVWSSPIKPCNQKSHFMKSLSSILHHKQYLGSREKSPSDGSFLSSGCFPWSPSSISMLRFTIYFKFSHFHLFLLVFPGGTFSIIQKKHIFTKVNEVHYVK